jgi:TRAP-type C4-dicarboxylate transport system substrate-binding protein
MKKSKWIVMLLVVALVVGLVALVAVSCDGGGGGGDTESTAPESTTSTEDPGTTYTGDDAFVVSVGMPSSASLYNTYLVPWTEAIAAASNGRVEFELYSSNTLVKEEQQIDSVLNGTSDITVFQPDWAAGVYPLGEFAELPLMFPDLLTGARVMVQLIEEYGLEEYQDFHVLGFGFISAAHYGGKVPAHLPSDLVGKQLRSGGATETEIIQALGAIAVPAGTDALATQLDRDAFQGLFLSWSFHAGNTNRWATNWTQVDLFLRPLIFVMAKDRWESLPAAVQQAFTDNSGIDAVLKYLAVEEQYVLDNTSVPGQKDRGLDRAAVAEQAEKLGTEIYVLSADEKAQWKAALEPVIQDWVERYASRLDTAAVLARAEELTAQFAAERGDAGATTTTAE